MSNLVAHAEQELKFAGLDKPDSDYGGMIYESVMELVKTHAKQDHSGFSHFMTIEAFSKVVNYKTLTPISSNPDEWFEHDYEMAGANCWQNKRQSSCFSNDGGKTWYDIDDRKKRNWPNRKWYQKVLDKLK